jgi:hypothetical protein
MRAERGASARVIYFFYDRNAPIYLLMVYATAKLFAIHQNIETITPTVSPEVGVLRTHPKSSHVPESLFPQKYRTVAASLPRSMYTH